MPGLDRVGDGPQRVALLAAELGVIGFELRRVVDLEPACPLVRSSGGLDSTPCRGGKSRGC